MSTFYQNYVIQAENSEVTKVAELLNECQKITILYGGGSRGSVDQLTAVADCLNAPLVHTTRSKEVVPNDHPHYVGGIGFMGCLSGNAAIQECEVLLVVGSNFAFREFYPKDAIVVQIEIDPADIGLHVPVQHALVGDAKLVLQQLLQQLKPKTDDSFLAKIKHKHVETMLLLDFYKRHKQDQTPIAPEAVTHCVSNHAADDAIYCIDSGLQIVWSNNYLHLNGQQRVIWSWHLASLACSLGYSLGCQLVDRKQQVIVLTGDGGFNMLVGDFATLVKYDLPVTIIVYNNSMYGFIEVDEVVEQGFARAGLELTNPDFAKLAEAYGGVGYTARTYEELEKVIPEALSNGKPTIIDVMVSHGLPAPSAKLEWEQAYNFIKSNIEGKILEWKKKLSS